MIILFSFGITATSVIAEEPIRVLLNGEELAFDVAPQIIDGRTMVPMRTIFEALGAVVSWDSGTQTITATQDDIVIIMQIGSEIIRINGEEIALDVPPVLVGGRTLVPVRAVAEGLDADVEWDGAARAVIITKQEQIQTVTRREIETFYLPYGRGGHVHGIRAFFEQQRFPEVVFGNSDKFIDLIVNGNISEIEDIIRTEWYFISAGVIAGHLTSQGEASMESIARKRAELGIDDRHIVSVTLEQINSSTNAIIIEMYYTALSRLGSFIAIVYDENEGLSYFSLERGLSARDDVPYVFCFTTPSERGGFFAIADNTKAAFINAIRALMSEDIENEVSLRVTVTAMVMRSSMAAMEGRENSMVAAISLYNYRGENVTSQFHFGRIELISSSQIIEGTIPNHHAIRQGEFFHVGAILNQQHPTLHFHAFWNPGQTVDIITVEAGHYGRDFVMFQTQNVIIGDITDAPRDSDGRIMW